MAAPINPLGEKKPGERANEATLHYTCAAGDEGATLRLAIEDGAAVEAQVTEVFDPPLYDKSKERVEKSHYFVKDFQPLKLGAIRLEKGRGTLKLSALKVHGRRVVDVHSLDLVLQPDADREE